MASKKRETTLVVYGSETGQTRAGKFGQAQAALAKKAAGLLGHTATELSTARFADLLKKVPAGRLYKSGSSFLPAVSRTLLDQLVAASQSAGRRSKPSNAVRAAAAKRSDHVKKSAETTKAEASPPPLPHSWDTIEPGQLVIAQEGPSDGWWEAIVVAREGELLTLRWRDYPDQAQVLRNVGAVALLKPIVVEDRPSS